jgi:2,4-dienoyl-CoA reductase-like NADH-dependent reductase (Old Yellow Enzyme family)
MSSYPHLLSPLQIGSVTVRNRIMQTAHVKLFARDGVDSERNVGYQIERARGGAALLITGNRLAHPTSTTGMPRFAFAYLSEAMRVDRKMTAGVHEHGAAIFAQLNHFGVNAASDVADDLRVLWGPSAVKSPAYGETAKAMEPEDIAEVVEWWGVAPSCHARRASTAPRFTCRTRTFCTSFSHPSTTSERTSTVAPSTTGCAFPAR